MQIKSTLKFTIKCVLQHDGHPSSLDNEKLRNSIENSLSKFLKSDLDDNEIIIRTSIYIQSFEYKDNEENRRAELKRKIEDADSNQLDKLYNLLDELNTESGKE